MANTALSLVSLDPDTIKNAFKSYMRSQDRYKDYDFDGSNIGAILDVLAYNTFLNSFYYNMAASEAFLDSAQLRTSLTSRAKELNYVPRSRRSASTSLDIVLTATGITSLIVPIGTQFTATYGLDTYTFTTTSSSVYYSSTGTFVIDDLKVYEGLYRNDTFAISYDDEAQRFTLPDPTIDTDSIIVTVVEDGSTATTYTRAMTLLDIDEKSRVFFLQGFGNGQYEIMFGDGRVGYKPPNNALVTVRYRSSQGSRANGSTAFVIDDDIVAASGGTLTSITITARAAASGGAEAESNDSIRFNAPRYYATQERAIISEDYRSLILANFPDIKDVQVYGGELVTTSPQYGRVFVSCATQTGEPLAQADKDDILAFISARNTNGIAPLYDGPEYTYVKASIKVRYDVNTSDLFPGEISSLVTNLLDTFNDENLNVFDAELRYSKLVQAIDDLDDSIVSNETDLTLFKTTTPAKNTPLTFTLDFQNQLFDDADTTVDIKEYSPAFYSSSFTINGASVGLQDDGKGALVLVQDTAAGKVLFASGLGTINYTTGVINVTGLSISDYIGELTFTAVPVRPNRNIIGTLNTVLVLDASSSTVTAVPVRV